MTFQKIFVLIAILVLACSSCSSKSTTEKPYDSLLPEHYGQNSCTIYGELENNKGQVITNEVVWLGKVLYDENEGSYFVIDGSRSPSTISDEKGYFEFINIELSDYVLIIGNLDDSPYILPESVDSDRAKVLQCEDGELINVGGIIVTPEN